MTTNEERLRILKMVQEGKIDSTEAARLLQALDSNPDSSSGSQTGNANQTASRTQKPRFLHIKVTKTSDNKPMVDVRLPITIVNAGIRMGAKFTPNLYGIDKDALLEMMNSPETQQIIDVTDDEDGERVQIFLE